MSGPNGQRSRLLAVFGCFLSSQMLFLLMVKERRKDIVVFPQIGVPQNGWFMMENPMKMDDLGYPYFRKHLNRSVFDHKTAFGGIFFVVTWFFRSILPEVSLKV